MTWRPRLHRDAAVRAQIASVEATIGQAPRTGGPFTVAVFGPKDPKTTTAVALARELAELRAEPTVLVCANTDLGTMRSVLFPPGTPPPAATLLGLGLALLGRALPCDIEPDAPVHLVARRPLLLRGMADLDSYLERAGRALYLITNDGIAPWILAELTRQQIYGAALSAAFAAIRLHAAVTVIDQGRNQAGPVSDAILAAADQLVIPAPAKPVELNLITSDDGALVQLVRRGHHELLARSVLAVTGMTAELDPYGTANRLAEHTGHALFASVVAVPYDRAVAGRDHTDLQPETRLAYLQVTAEVAAAMSLPRLARLPLGPPVAVGPDEAPPQGDASVFPLRPITPPPDAAGV